MSAKPSMLRKEAIAALYREIGPDRTVVLANGYVSRDGFNCAARASHFYMLGSMGLAASIALGVALARPESELLVLDGDGNLLMGLGVLPMVGSWQPRRFLHVVLDNATYGSTGGQPTVSPAVDLAAAARASGYRRGSSVSDEASLRRLAREWVGLDGPSLLHVRVSGEEPLAGRRVDLDPPDIARAFGRSIREAAL